MPKFLEGAMPGIACGRYTQAPQLAGL